jgi:hypothetical protein
MNIASVSNEVHREEPVLLMSPTFHQSAFSSRRIYPFHDFECNLEVEIGQQTAACVALAEP